MKTGVKDMVTSVRQILLELYADAEILKNDRDRERQQDFLSKVRSNSQAVRDLINIYNQHCDLIQEKHLNRQDVLCVFDPCLKDFLSDLAGLLSAPVPLQEKNHGELARERSAQIDRVKKLANCTRKEGFDLPLKSVLAQDQVGVHQTPVLAEFLRDFRWEDSISDLLYKYANLLSKQNHDVDTPFKRAGNFDGRFIYITTYHFSVLTGSSHPAVAVRFLNLLHDRNRPLKFGKDNQYKN